jgi:hypothetical protein
MKNIDKEQEDLSTINKDLNIFGKTYVEKLKKLSVFIYGLRGV